MLCEKRSCLKGVLGLGVVLALAGHVSASSFLSRREKHAKAIDSDVCIDTDNNEPPPLRFGYPSWKTADDPNCQTKWKVDKQGQCLSSLAPENGCNTFCQLTNGWFYGEPIDANAGRWCEVGQACSKTISISKTNGDSTTINSGEGYVDNTVRSNSSESKDNTALSMGVNANLGVGLDNEKPVKMDAKAGAHAKWDSTFSKSRTEAWSRTVTDTKTWSVNNSTTFSINIAESESWSRPGWSNNYCGNWFAVPIVGISCGRGAMGREAINREERLSACFLRDPEHDVFSHCFSYTFADTREQDMTKYRMAFVLRDCETGTVLPGEWQHAFFRESFHPEIYTRQHIERYGYNNLPSGWPEKPDDAAWVRELHGQATLPFSRTLGPEDHTIKVCGPQGYCVRHKLTDGNCYTFPRGHQGQKSVNIVSAATTPGNCCTLFSRAECHGSAQNVRGTLDEAQLLAVGYRSQAHSVVCNVDQYCNPNVIDTLEPLTA
ncbi:hypothetical protein V8F20_012390 [Naviculisporaceae sp. PSN 640]